MCDFFDWGRDDDDKKTAREQLRNAMAQQFNAIYGTEVEDTNSWQGLCQVLEIYPIPGELEACRKVFNFQPHSLPLIGAIIEGGMRNQCQHR